MSPPPALRAKTRLGRNFFVASNALAYYDDAKVLKPEIVKWNRYFVKIRDQLKLLLENILIEFLTYQPSQRLIYIGKGF
jgi:hypothetical protein